MFLLFQNFIYSSALSLDTWAFKPNPLVKKINFDHPVIFGLDFEIQHNLTIHSIKYNIIHTVTTLFTFCESLQVNKNRFAPTIVLEFSSVNMPDCHT